MYEVLGGLRDFRTRSRLVYGLMAASFLAALASAFLLPGQVGVVSFVAFLNFIAGLWIAQSIHALGHTVAGAPEPAPEEAVELGPGLFEEIAWERFLRIGVVLAAAATVFVFTASEVLSPGISVVAVGAIGAIVLLAAMLGFLIAAASTLDHEGDGVSATTVTARNGDDETIATEER